MISIDILNNEAIKSDFLRLFESVFRSPHDSNLFDWKYLTNPSEYLDTHMVVARQNRQLIGVRPFLSMPLTFHGRTLRSVQPIDTMVAAEHRGQGILTEMNKKAIAYSRSKNIDVFFNFPNHRSRAVYFTQGWTQIAALENATLLLRRRSALANAGLSLFQSASEGAVTISIDDLFLCSRGRRIYGKAQLLEITNSGAALELLSSSKSHLFSLSHDINFLKWRLIEHPNIKYYLFTPHPLEPGNQYILFSLTKRPDNLIATNIVDIYPSDQNGLDDGSILKDFVDLISGTKCHILTFSGKSSPAVWEAFRSRKNAWAYRSPIFQRTSHSTILAGYLLNSKRPAYIADSFYNPNNWHLTQILQDTA